MTAARVVLLALLLLCAAAVLAFPEGRPVAPLVVPFGGYIGLTLIRRRTG